MATRYKTDIKCYRQKEDWQDEYYCNYTYDDKVLLFCDYDTKEVVVREGTEVICDEAFYGSKIESIFLPKSLKAIGEKAFKGCRYLCKVVIMGDMPFIGAHTFDDCVSLREVIVPETSLGNVRGSFGCAFVCTKEQKDFLDNVWFFIEKAAPYIWKYPKIAMAKIPFESGTAQTGGFCPTLGAMLRWWMFSDLGNVLDMDGQDRGYALCRLSGSLLSGVNSCLAVDRQGNRRYVQVHPLSDYYRELCAVQGEFNEKYPDVVPLEFEEALMFLKDKMGHREDICR